jgi:hypothetical protein
MQQNNNESRSPQGERGLLGDPVILGRRRVDDPEIERKNAISAFRAGTEQQRSIMLMASPWLKAVKP